MHVSKTMNVLKAKSRKVKKEKVKEPKNWGNKCLMYEMERSGGGKMREGRKIKRSGGRRKVEREEKKRKEREDHKRQQSF